MQFFAKRTTGPLVGALVLGSGVAHVGALKMNSKFLADSFNFDEEFETWRNTDSPPRDNSSIDVNDHKAHDIWWDTISPQQKMLRSQALKWLEKETQYKSLGEEKFFEKLAGGYLARSIEYLEDAFSGVIARNADMSNDEAKILKLANRMSARFDELAEFFFRVGAILPEDSWPEKWGPYPHVSLSGMGSDGIKFVQLEELNDGNIFDLNRYGVAWAARQCADEFSADEVFPLNTGRVENFMRLYIKMGYMRTNKETPMGFSPSCIQLKGNSYSRMYSFEERGKGPRFIYDTAIKQDKILALIDAGSAGRLFGWALKTSAEIDKRVQAVGQPNDETAAALREAAAMQRKRDNYIRDIFIEEFRMRGPVNWGEGQPMQSFCRVVHYHVNSDRPAQTCSAIYMPLLIDPFHTIIVRDDWLEGMHKALVENTRWMD